VELLPPCASHLRIFLLTVLFDCGIMGGSRRDRCGLCPFRLDIHQRRAGEGKHSDHDQDDKYSHGVEFFASLIL
jgi:hypothetical protein